VLNKLGLIKILPWAAFPLTGLLLVLYPLLPQKQLIILPSQETYGELYTGAQDQNKPEAIWLNRPETWQCTTHVSSYYQFCGINLLWQDPAFNSGRDLSGYTNLNLEMSYQGSAEQLKLFFRNADPAYTKEGDGNSAQFNFTMIRKEHILNNSISIELSELTVADWWMNQYNHPRKYAKPSFKHIAAIGIDFSGNNFDNTAHKITLKEISLTGPYISKPNYYLSILTIWMLSVFCILSLRLFEEQKKRNLLAVKNKSLKQQSAEYKTQSHYDLLTKQLNRRGFEYQLNQNPLTSDISYFIILIDLDHFKKLNDTFGHSAGDTVLQEVAVALKQGLRQNDLFARWGGEEFIVLIKADNLENAVQLAEKLRNIIAAIKLTAIEGMPITTSLGIAKWGEDEEFESAFNRADKNLYLAKAEGRNRVCY